MTMQIDNSQQRILNALITLAANADKEFPEALLATWFKLISQNGYSADQVENACLWLIENYEFHCIPPFASFKKAVEKTSGILDKEEQTTLDAENEWVNLLDNISYYGSYTEPHFDPVTSLVVDSLGGWKVICQWKESELHWRHDDFVERYKMYEGKKEFLLPLDTLNNRQNRVITMQKLPTGRACAREDGC